MAQIKSYAAAAIVIFAISAVPLAARQDPAPKAQPKPEQPAPAGKAAKPVTDRVEITKSFTIESIDYKTREVTLKDKDGNVNTVVASPKIERFNNLKVGDTVTMHYYEAIVYSIRPTGATSTAGTTSSMVKEKGEKPGGTYAEQYTASVAVTAIDTSAPSITVKTDAGKTMTLQVKDKKNLEGVHVGDHVDITYTRALAVKVE